MAKETYVTCLLDLFRQYGYDGATLSKISQGTGLGKASLYYHFPGGKDDMVNTVLNFIEQNLEQNILQTLHTEDNAPIKFQRMCTQISEVYKGGQQPCLTAILLAGSARDIFRTKVHNLLHAWINGIANVLIEAGLDSLLARQRGEDAIIAIQGALILAQGLNDLAPFQRVLKRLPEELCRDL